MVVAGGVTVTGAPELTAPTPWSMLAEAARAKSAVRQVLLPAVMVPFWAVKETMAAPAPGGAGGRRSRSPG